MNIQITQLIIYNINCTNSKLYNYTKGFYCTFLDPFLFYKKCIILPSICIRHFKILFNRLIKCLGHLLDIKYNNAI